MANNGHRVDDETLIKLNDLGLSFKRIGEITGYHLATIHVRLKELGIKNVDTRRAFMDDVYKSLTPRQREWLIKEVNPGQPISQFIRMLIIKEFNASKP